jgi:hypothetical protein
LDSCFTNVHTQKPILEQKLSPCVPFRDIDKKETIFLIFHVKKVKKHNVASN